MSINSFFNVRRINSINVRDYSVILLNIYYIYRSFFLFFFFFISIAISRSGLCSCALQIFNVIPFDYRTSGRISENIYSFTAEANDNKARFRCEASNIMSQTPLKAEVDLTVMCKCFNTIEIWCEDAISHRFGIIFIFFFSMCLANNIALNV